MTLFEGLSFYFFFLSVQIRVDSLPLLYKRKFSELDDAPRNDVETFQETFKYAIYKVADVSGENINEVKGDRKKPLLYVLITAHLLISRMSLTAKFNLWKTYTINSLLQ